MPPCGLLELQVSIDTRGVPQGSFDASRAYVLHSLRRASATSAPSDEDLYIPYCILYKFQLVVK